MQRIVNVILYKLFTYILLNHIIIFMICTTLYTIICVIVVIIILLLLTLSCVLFYFRIIGPSELLSYCNETLMAVLIQGQVGTGKTAFMKCCAFSWASNGTIPGQAGGEHPLKEMDLVVFIDKTHERKTWEATFKKAVHGNSFVKQQAWAMLNNKRNKQKIAILVDGINEFQNQPVIDAIFDMVKNRTCHVVVTCRTYHDVLRNQGTSIILLSYCGNTRTTIQLPATMYQ